MQYDIIVQGSLFKTIDTNGGGYNIGEIVAQVDTAISNEELVVDAGKPLNIQVLPHTE